MQRLAFLAALASASLPRPVARGMRPVDVAPLVARFPGIVGVYARALSPDVAGGRRARPRSRSPRPRW